jgi:hypothetical protein
MNQTQTQVQTAVFEPLTLTVETFQWNGEPVNKRWHYELRNNNGQPILIVKAHGGGWCHAHIGDWLIKANDGSYYVFKSRFFETISR